MKGPSDALRDAQTYRVDTHDGRVGSVAAVLPGARPDAAGFLLMQSGLMRCRLVAIPFDDVEEVDPTRRRVLLRDAPESM